MSSRGIVVTPRFTVTGTSLHFPGLVGIEPDDLRFYLLYWDKIDFPDNNILHIGSSPDDQFLIEAGVMTRTNFAGQGSGMETVYVDAQLGALRELNSKNPGQWALAQTSNAFFFPASKSTETRSIEVELFSALPVPTGDIALDDILQFKERRCDELVRLQTAMDNLYLEIDRSNDIPRAKSAAISELENTLIELNRVANESWATRLLPSLRIEFSLSELATSAAAGEIVGERFGLMPGSGAAIGAVSAALKLSYSSVQKVNGLPDELKDYAYLNRISDDLGT